MTNCQELAVKLTNSQLIKLKSAAKNKTETILRLNKKDAILTNPCFCVVGYAFCILYFCCTLFQAIFSFN